MIDERYKFLNIKATLWKGLLKYCVGLHAQSCLTLCNSMDCSPPGSSVHRIFQARIQEWEPFPSPEDLPNSGIEPESPALQADSLPAEVPRKPNGSIILIQNCCYLVAKSCLTLLRPHGPPARLLCPWTSLVAQTQSDKESACNLRDPSSIPVLGRSPGEDNGYPL